MPTLGSGRFRRILVCLTLPCLAVFSPAPARAQDAGSPGPGFVFVPPPCQGNVFLDVDCSGLFDAWIEQYARDGITGGCAINLYCPTNNVTRGQMAVFVEKAMRGALNWPPNTVLVHAVLKADGSPDATASGAALLQTLALIPTSGPTAPSSGNLWLVRVGPGTFDLAAAQLVLPNYVVLEGSGFAAPGFGSPLTIVTAAGSDAFTGTIVAAPSYSEIHRLGVRSTGGTRAIGISNGGTLVLDRVVSVASGANSSFAVYSTGGDVSVSESFLSSAGNGVNSNMSLYAEATAVRVQRSRIGVFGTTNSNGAYGVYVVGGSLELEDSHIESGVGADTPIYGVRLSAGATGQLLRSEISVRCQGTAFANGLYPQAPPSAVSVRHSRISVSGTGCEANAVLAFDSSLAVSDSDLIASSTTSASALKTTAANSAPNILVHRSTLQGSGNAIDNISGFTTRVGGSFLSGTVVNAGTLACVSSYNGAFAALNASCQ